MCQGAVVSLEVFFLTLILAVPLALPVAFGRMTKNKIVHAVVSFYVLVMRGTPLILQLIFVYFAPKYLAMALGLTLSYDRFTAVIIAFVINYAAYFAEIYRGGIQAIPKGQFEAAHMLGFTKWQTYSRIILPQVVKQILPAMGNEVITLVKDTALAQTIGVAELFHAAQNASAREFSTVPIFVAGVFYFVMNWVVSFVFEKGEKKLAYYSLLLKLSMCPSPLAHSPC
jgi:polar amino acid transport system permease protein